MKSIYFDCPTGISGDMCLGALVDLGVPLDYLEQTLSRLGIAQEYCLSIQSVHQNGQQAKKAQVDLHAHPFNPEINRDNVPAHSHTNDSRLIGRDSLPVSLNPDKITVSKPDHHHPQLVRYLPDIQQLIVQAALPSRAETWSLAIFQNLAIAEGAVHGIAPEQVHFHEVGATDAIVDIVGTCLGLDWLGVDVDESGIPCLYCSALPIGGGTVHAAHGRLPVPAPAVLKLLELRQVPIYSNGIERELVTPTGAAIVTTLVRHFGAPPAMTLTKVGLGAGSISLPIPNILRLWMGEVGMGHSLPLSDQRSGINPPFLAHNHQAEEAELVEGQAEEGGEVAQDGNRHSHPQHQQHQQRQLQIQSDGNGHSHPQHQLQSDRHNPPQETNSPPQEPDRFLVSDRDTIICLETQIDDLVPQAIGYVFEQLFAVGAVDVFTQTIGMKKSRPGFLLTVLCPPEVVDDCERVIFQETTTLGIRRSSQDRSILPRQMECVETDYGTVRVKVAWDRSHQEIINFQPEYEDCAQLARSHQVPWREVHRQAYLSWYQQQDKDSGRVSKI